MTIFENILDMSRQNCYQIFCLINNQNKVLSRFFCLAKIFQTQFQKESQTVSQHLKNLACEPASSSGVM